MNYASYQGPMNMDLLEGMIPCGEWGLPAILKTNAKPTRVIGFDKAVAKNENDYTQWVHFYQHDSRFQRLLRNPWRYIPILLRYEGVISPDCSVFWDYPLYRQLESIGRSRELGSCLQRCGANVIQNYRWGKPNTYAFAFDCIETGGTVAVGTLGCMREKEPRLVFEQGFEQLRLRVQPDCIVVVGSRKSPVFAEAEQDGIEIIAFEGSTAEYFRKKAM